MPDRDNLHNGSDSAQRPGRSSGAQDAQDAQDAYRARRVHAIKQHGNEALQRHREQSEARRQMSLALQSALERLLGIAVPVTLGVPHVTLGEDTFTMSAGWLVVLKPCALCGEGTPSPPVRSEVDLGYALTEHTYECEDCLMDRSMPERTAGEAVLDLVVYEMQRRGFRLERGYGFNPEHGPGPGPGPGHGPLTEPGDGDRDGDKDADSDKDRRRALL